MEIDADTHALFFVAIRKKGADDSKPTLAKWYYSEENALKERDRYNRETNYDAFCSKWVRAL